MKHLEFKQLKDITTSALALAKKNGATQADIHASIDNGFIVTVRLGELDTVEHHHNKAIGLTVYFGKRKGSVTTSDTSKNAIHEAVNAACNIAKFTEEDPYSGLANPELMAKNITDLDLYHEWDMTPQKAIELALNCETYANSLDKRIKNSEGISISSHKDFSVYANSHGFLGMVPSTQHCVNYVLIAEENGQMERDSDYTAACDAKDLENFNCVAEKAVKSTILRLGSQKLVTQKAPVIFIPEVAKGLLATFIAAITGNQLYRKASFLLNHLGKPVFSKHVRIHEDPFVLKALGSAAFDSEGVATYKKDFIKDGILESYVLGSYAARKLKMKTTANADGIHNLFIENSEMDLTALLKKMDKGLLVTELIGQGINIVTGDYSRGAVGFWVENGKIQYPVSEITIAGNLRDMFLNLAAVGNDVDRRGNIKTGSILLEEMMIGGS